MNVDIALPGQHRAGSTAPASRARLLRGAAWLLAAAAVPLVMQGYELFLVTSILIMAIALLGLNLLAGYAGLLSLGHGAIFAMGAYAAALLQKNGAVPLILVPVLAGIVCLIFGRGFAFALQRLEGMQFALATFALAIVAPQLLRYDLLQRWSGGSQGIAFTRGTPPEWLMLSSDNWLYVLVVVHLLIAAFVIDNVRRGPDGRALLALKDNALSASAMGIDTVAAKCGAFELSAFFAGIAGALNALLVQFVAPDSFPFFLSITLFIGLVVGGIGSTYGPLLGACFIVLVPNFAEQLSQAATSAIYGGVVVALMLAEPNGLAGIAERVWHLRRFLPTSPNSNGDQT